MSTRTATNGRALEENILKTVEMSVRPVALAFLDAEPAGLKKFEGPQPSGCSFWRPAAQGHTFYTVPENHFNCAVGACTHNIALSHERERETEQTLNVRSWLCETGRSSANTTLGRGAEGCCVFASGRCSS